MKKLSPLLCLILILCPIITFALADGPIDPSRPSSLTLEYRRGDRVFSGLDVQSFRVATVSEDGSYDLTGDFAGYPVSIHGVTSQAEWRQIASTLAAYIQADGISPTCTGTTGSDGTVHFDELLPGMYLTLSVRHVSPEETTVFETFLTVLPQPAEIGEHLYDVTAIPKSTSFPRGETTRLLRVVKLWKDHGFTQERPDAVTVDILKDGAVQSTQILSQSNGWSYTQTVPDDGSLWQAVERNVAENYTVTCVDDGNGGVVITNTYRYGDEDVPATGHTILIWFYVMLLCSGGCILLLLAAHAGRKAR